MNNTKETIVSNFLEFAVEANSRSTVDIRDGLKPVHRRLIYTLSGMKKGSYIGGAKVIGEVLGNYHPHGDTSVYNAAVRLSQPFKTRYPLIDIDGNNGTISQPMGFAAMRYVKMKLSSLGEAVLEDIRKNTVPMMDNYDGSLLEPEFLPGFVPVTLMNGTLGIGVGMATSIPPHNLREVARAVSHLVDNPEASVRDLMRFIKGPDFPTGGTITNPEALLDAYENGSGSAKIRAEYEIKTIKGKTHIIIKEVPYLVDPERMIIQPLRELHAEGYEFIEDIEVQTGLGVPFQLDIELTKDAPVFLVVEKLLKETSIESSYTINLTTYVGDNKFQRKNLKELLEAYIEQNYDRNRKAAQFDISKAEARKLIVVALIKATARIEEVIKIIKGSSNTSEAKLKLGELLEINDTQATAILAMRLSQLTKLDVNKLENELLELDTLIKSLTNFLESKNLQLEKVRDDLNELALKYGDARRTAIREEADSSEVQDVIVSLTEDNEIFVQPADGLPENRRNTKGKRGDNLISVAKTKSNGVILLVSDKGMAYPVEVASLTVSDDVIKNTVDNFGIQGKAVQVLIPRNKNNLITITKNHIIKRTSLLEYNKNSSFRLCKVREDDSLEKVFLLDDSEKVVMLLDNKKYVAFDVEEIRSTGQNTIGTKLSSYKVADVVAGEELIIFVDADGNGKTVKVGDLQTSGRKTNGLACNDAVMLASAAKDDFVYIYGDTGHSIRVPIRSVSTVKSATAKGVILYNGNIAKILTR